MTNIKTSWNLVNTYAGLPDFFYSKLNLSKVRSPQLVALNENLAQDLGLNTDELKSREGVEILSGNALPQGSIPIALAYAGHQFGYFTMLGDGRAMLLGEQVTPGGIYDIQLKGSGITPYSRGGDGRAALGPMLREYIVSEAMHNLRIPTTRSLAVVTTGEYVIRDKILKGAVLTRTASSHIRVGTFEYAAYFGTRENVRQLADYTIERHFRDLAREADKYLHFLKEVVKRQASLIAKWQLTGFVHGVMNTDNMAISGETIDYGPCAFMDAYNPDIVYSSIDTYGRYAYKNQPKIGLWNLSRFAETLLPLINENRDKAVQLAQDAVNEFNPLYHKNLMSGMRSKLGIFNEEAADEELIGELLNIMQKNNEDYTNIFLKLTFGDPIAAEAGEFKEWHKKWQARLQRQAQTKEEVFELMKNSNPAVIPRNHRVEEALIAADEEGDYSVMNNLINVLSKPFAHTPDQKEYEDLPPPSFCNYKTFCGT
jgi:uncharacterized protein YdiU (UPF0061 family)